MALKAESLKSCLTRQKNSNLRDLENEGKSVGQQIHGLSSRSSLVVAKTRTRQQDSLSPANEAKPRSPCQPSDRISSRDPRSPTSLIIVGRRDRIARH